MQVLLKSRRVGEPVTQVFRYTPSRNCESRAGTSELTQKAGELSLLLDELAGHPHRSSKTCSTQPTLAPDCFGAWGKWPTCAHQK
jgi:hypothetical protein